MTFKTLQVVSDLQSAAVAGFSDLATLVNPALEPDLRRLVFQQESRLTQKDTTTLHAELMMIASLPDQNRAGFVTATIVLLADRLQYGAGKDDMFWNWDAFQDHYRQAAPPIRAALMNGFKTAHFLGLVTLDPPPDGNDLRTYDEAELVVRLKRVSHLLTPDLRDLVSSHAPEEIRAVHRFALDNCLKGSCILSHFGGWFPRDVVEKVSQNADHPAYQPVLP